MHILFLSDNFPPEVNAPASRTFEHCREWVKLGHKVTVITCAPNFPGGKVYAGYKNKLWQSEQVNDITVIRVWSYIAANAGVAKRIIDYMSFVPTSVLASLFILKADIVIGTSPQFFTACASYIIGMLKNIPFVFEVRDIWPESIKVLGVMKDSFIIRWIVRLELFLYRKATVIITATNSLKTILINRGVDESKINVITNGVDISHFIFNGKDFDLIKKHKLDGKFVAGYVGTHGLAHHLETILEAAKIAQENNNNNIRFILLGNGALKSSLVNLAKDMNLTNITFIDSVAKEDVPKYWSLLDVSIIHLKKIELFTGAIPSKLFECMAMGIPVLLGVLGEAATIVEKNKVGIVFEPENPEALYNALVFVNSNPAIHEEMKKQSLLTAKFYDRKNLAVNLLDILKNIKL